MPPEAWTVNMLTVEFCGFSDGVSDGIGNVVEFEVEKNFTAGSHQVANDLGPLGRKQLLTDFIYVG